jgi:hypothetical protein
VTTKGVDLVAGLSLCDKLGIKYSNDRNGSELFTGISYLRELTFGVLFGNRWYARHAAMAPFSTQPPQEPAYEQLGVEPVGLRSAMFARYRNTRGMARVLGENQRFSHWWDPQISRCVS